VHHVAARNRDVSRHTRAAPDHDLVRILLLTSLGDRSAAAKYQKAQQSFTRVKDLQLKLATSFDLRKNFDSKDLPTWLSGEQKQALADTLNNSVPQSDVASAWTEFETDMKALAQPPTAQLDAQHRSPKLPERYFVWCKTNRLSGRKRRQ
jgi:hypothetical protein